jgi:hypothetical protein
VKGNSPGSLWRFPIDLVIAAVVAGVAAVMLVKKELGTMRLIGTVLNARVGRIGNAVRGFHPIVLVRRVGHLDVVQHLHPVRRIAARNDEPERNSVLKRQRRAVQHVA